MAGEGFSILSEILPDIPQKYFHLYQCIFTGHYCSSETMLFIKKKKKISLTDIYSDQQ